MSATAPPAWDHPIALGRRLCWYDGENNRTLPIIEVESLYTDERDLNEFGFHAILPTENGVTVQLTFDPGGEDEESRELVRARGEGVTLWLFVKHPVTDKLCAATIRGDRAVYDFWCGDECSCTHEHGGWFEYVHSVDEVLDRLAHLGRLRIEANQ